MVKKCSCGTINANGTKKCSGCGSPFFKQKLEDIKKDIKSKI